MKVSGVVAFKCETVATLDPVTFETPESFITLDKWSAKKAGSISFDFRTTEPNGLLLFSHGKPKPQQQKDPKSPKTLKVDFFAIEMLDGTCTFCSTWARAPPKPVPSTKKSTTGNGTTWTSRETDDQVELGSVLLMYFLCIQYMVRC